MTQRNITLTLTDVGRAALVNAAQNSMDVQFSAIALGSGTALLDNTAKALTSQQEQQEIFSASQLGPGQLSISALFNTDPAAAYSATELALIGDGVVFGVWSTTDPTQALVVRTPGVPYTATITIGYAQLPSQNVSVVIQPLDAAAQALVGDAVANAINAHVAAENPHPQYALKEGTTFTGPVNVPLPATGDSSALAAPTAWVTAAIAALVNSAPGTLDTLKQLADAIGDDPNFSVTLANALALKAALAGAANQVFSVANATQNSHAVPMGQIATLVANILGASPQLGGTPTGPTPAQFDSSGKFATTEFVKLAGLQFSTTANISASRNLADSDVGAKLLFQGPFALTIATPSSIGAQPGDAVVISAYGANTGTVSFSETTYAYGTAGQSAPLTVSNGESLMLVVESPTTWQVGPSTAGLGNIGSFGAFLGTPGYQKLPGGFILQFGVSNFSVGGTPTTFPLWFPNALILVGAFSASTSQTAVCASATQSGFTGISGQGGTFPWLAMGK